jgi:transposase
MNKMEPCGIEVSARELLVAVESGGQSRMYRLANTATGHRKLLHTLTRGGRRVRVVMESTGLYGLDVAVALSDCAGVELMVANPRAVRHFAQACMQRSKNDQLDAVVLREFARRMEFKPWTRPQGPVLVLWSIARRLESLTNWCTAEKNRGHAAGISQATPACVRKDIARSLRVHQQSMKELRREALACIAADAQMQRRYALLRTVRGIGEISAIQILAELMLLPEDRDVRQWVAYAGLDPKEHSSGTSVRKYTRISKVGNRHLRHALYMPALVASRFEPHLRAFYEHLLARGKKKRQALIAVARKLLHAIYGMFRSDRPFDGARLYASPAPPLITVQAS